MNYNADERRARKIKRQRENKRRLIVMYAMAGCVAVLVLLSITLIILGIAINRKEAEAVARVEEEQRAYEDYLSRNWAEITIDADGKKHGTVYVENVPYEYVDDKTYYPGIVVDGIDLGGMTYAEARAALMAHVDAYLLGLNDVTVRVEDVYLAQSDGGDDDTDDEEPVSVTSATLLITANDYGVTTNVNQILQDAYRLGRESANDYSANYVKQQDMLINNEVFTIEYTFDYSRVKETVAAFADALCKAPVDAYVSINTRPSANAQDGAETDGGNDYIPTVHDDGTVIETVYAENGVAIADIIFNPGIKGRSVDVDATYDMIIEAINSESVSVGVLNAVTVETEPEISVEDLCERVRLISHYESYFNSSSLNRRRNIQKAAGILNGCTMLPGQEISFNEYIGPRTEAGGWLPAAGITGGQMYEDSPGGGICQVSSTLYNALLACGQNRIEITRRQHHSWPSDYVPYGLDATVDTHGPDLCWKNISEGEMYIFAYADTTPGQRTMYVYVYGMPQEDGSYFETYAETIDEIPPGETIIIENPLWPTGYQREKVKARMGYRTIAYLKHFDANGELIEMIELYRDYYVPVTGQIEVGTGDPNLPTPTE